jgi:hypothetical protein
VTGQDPNNAAYLILEYLGSRVRWRVLGRWKTTEKRGLRCFFWIPFFTALAAFWANALASLPADEKSSVVSNYNPRHRLGQRRPTACTTQMQSTSYATHRCAAV